LRKLRVGVRGDKPSIPAVSTTQHKELHLGEEGGPVLAVRRATVIGAVRSGCITADSHQKQGDDREEATAIDSHSREVAVWK